LGDGDATQPANRTANNPVGDGGAAFSLTDAVRMIVLSHSIVRQSRRPVRRYIRVDRAHSCLERPFNAGH
jgi:hypothetical protein